MTYFDDETGARLSTSEVERSDREWCDDGKAASLMEGLTPPSEPLDDYYDEPPERTCRHTYTVVRGGVEVHPVCGRELRGSWCQFHGEQP